MEPAFRPSLSPEQTEKHLATLLVRGPIVNSALNRAIERLDERFRNYSAFYPHGLWAPGLVITGEMRGCTEQYLPMSEIRSAFRQLFFAALHYQPSDESTPFLGATSWLDLLQRLRLSKDEVNPSTLLRKLVTDESDRIRFLFSALLPSHHGGCFLRYPEQLHYLKGWIQGKRRQFNHGVRCLDTACGTGEGTYDLLALFLKCGLPVRALQIHGSSLEPLEVFAAAHGYFPHDPEKQKRFHAFMEPLLATNAPRSVVFFQDDILRHPSPDEKPYDIILCNGLLGGPFLHEQGLLEGAITAMAKRLGAGGILLAADRFHAGWKKENPPIRIVELMRRIGLEVHQGEYGIAAENNQRE